MAVSFFQQNSALPFAVMQRKVWVLECHVSYLAIEKDGNAIWVTEEFREKEITRTTCSRLARAAEWRMPVRGARRYVDQRTEMRGIYRRLMVDGVRRKKSSRALLDLLVRKWFEQKTYQSIINQPINRPFEYSINQSSLQSINQSIDRSSIQSINRVCNQSTNQSTVQVFNQSIEFALRCAPRSNILLKLLFPFSRACDVVLFYLKQIWLYIKDVSEHIPTMASYVTTFPSHNAIRDNAIKRHTPQPPRKM